MIQNQSGYAVKIGDVVLKLRSTDRVLEPHVFYKSFLTTDERSDIDINVHFGAMPEIKPEHEIFNSGGVWRLYSWQEQYVFTFISPVIGPDPYKMAIFDSKFARGDVYIQINNGHGNGAFSDVLEYPLDEVLMVNYLSQGRGIDIHACGVSLDSGGLAFVGVSGAGKSTLAGLWKNRNVKILSDDRLILRKQSDSYWVYGTPWHGDARAALPDKATLKSILFLKQAPTNRVVLLRPADAASRLMVRCFPTFYNAQGMEYILRFITELAIEVPCYELQFTPDQRAIDVVMSVIEKSPTENISGDII